MEASSLASAGDIASPSDDDTTQMIRVPPTPPAAAAGYVPPSRRPHVRPRAGRRRLPRPVRAGPRGA